MRISIIGEKRKACFGNKNKVRVFVIDDENNVVIENQKIFKTKKSLMEFCEKHNIEMKDSQIFVNTVEKLPKELIFGQIV